MRVGTVGVWIVVIVDEIPAFHVIDVPIAVIVGAEIDMRGDPLTFPNPGDVCELRGVS